MKYFPFLLVCILFSSCRSGNYSQQVSYKAISLKYKLPITSGEKEVQIVYFPTYTIYAIPITRSSYLDSFDKEGVSISKEVSSDVNFRYIVRKNSDSFGYRFEYLNAEKGQRVKIDSLLLRYSVFAFQNNKLYEKLQANFTSMGTEKVDRLKRIDRYINLQSKNQDSIKLTFSFDRDELSVDFTFSKKLDSASRAKLTKVELFYTPTVDTNSVNNKQAIIQYELADLELKNGLEITDFLEKVRQKHYN